ncbi:MAG: SAM-dependent methyltransferase [Bacteroidales bacterium]
MLGKLYLIPSTLGGDNPEDVIPSFVLNKLRELRCFLAEDIRTARRYLSRVGMPVPITELKFELLNKHTKQEDISKLLTPIMQGDDVGIVSEAGLPAVADPGANLIAVAHAKGIQIVPLTGPSSVTLALMASGLNGQNFAFVGYLPIKEPERSKQIRQLEKISGDFKQSQFFIETPYRNNQLMQALVSTLKPSTLIHVSCDLTLPSEFTVTKMAKEWKKEMPDLHKRPSIFGIQAF